MKSLSVIFVSLVLPAALALAQSQTKAPTKPAPPSALVQELVLANHILANEGVVDAYGHVSVRDPNNANHYWLARHLAAGVVTAADIIEYDLDSKPVSGDPSAGYTERFI